MSQSNRHERVPEALADRRQQHGVDRRDPEGSVTVPQHAVAPVVLLPPVDLPVAVAATGPGDRFLRYLVGRLLERPDLLLPEDSPDREQAVPVELSDLVVAEHRFPPD
jgi:hypothetical protein